MQAGRGALGIALIAALTLAACSSDDPRLMNVRSNTSGPDEFGILPPKPLEMPEDLASLPEPTPGGANRTDQTPKEDAIAALGGRAPVARGVGAPASDSALISRVTRYGISSSIRQTLAAEDLEYRRANDGRLLERLFSVNVYFRAYAPMSLNQHAELERWRAVGARNVSAPPALDGE